MFLSLDYLDIYTSYNQALQIITILKKYVQCYSSTITDATAGMGGNSFSFCKYFKYVYCIDNNRNCINYLEHNLEQYSNINL